MVERTICRNLYLSQFHQTLAEMVSWLVSEGVTHVTMEATGIYWKPIFHALCEAERPLEVLLVNARRPWWLIRVHEARASSRRARWLVRVRSSGWPFHQACSRIRLTATAAWACSRRVLPSPR